MSDSDVQAILRRLDRMERRMEQGLVEAFDRLRAVELWKARLEGAQWAAGRVPVLVACVASLVAIVLGVAALA